MKGFRTMASSAFTVVCGLTLTMYEALQTIGVDVKALVSDNIPTDYVGVAVVAIGLWFGYCRYITTTALGDSGTAADKATEDGQ